MTTIAYKDGIIASDGLATMGDLIVANDLHKCRIREGVRFFFCGTMADVDQIMDAYLSGDDSISASCSVEAFVVDSGSVLRIWADDSSLKIEQFIPSCFAIGSGAPYAIGAMMHGATAKEAVKVASMCDIFTGGRIRTYTV